MLSQAMPLCFGINDRAAVHLVANPPGEGQTAPQFAVRITHKDGERVRDAVGWAASATTTLPRATLSGIRPRPGPL
jgi:hypothetical protein